MLTHIIAFVFGMTAGAALVPLAAWLWIRLQRFQ